MKKTLLILFLLYTTTTIFGRNDYDNERVYNLQDVEVQPTFLGENNDFLLYIRKNYSIEEIENTIRGKLITQFIIEPDGTISNIKVIEDLGSGTAEEIIRVLNNCPKWKPGSNDSKNVRVLYEFPLTLYVN